MGSYAVAVRLVIKVKIILRGMTPSAVLELDDNVPVRWMVDGWHHGSWHSVMSS